MSQTIKSSTEPGAFLNWVKGQWRTWPDEGFHGNHILHSFRHSSAQISHRTSQTLHIMPDLGQMARSSSCEPEMHGNGLKSTVVFHGYHIPLSFCHSLGQVCHCAVFTSSSQYNARFRSGGEVNRASSSEALGSRFENRSFYEYSFFSPKLKSPQSRGHTWIFELSEGGGDNQKILESVLMMQRNPFGDSHWKRNFFTTVFRDYNLRPSHYSSGFFHSSKFFHSWNGLETKTLKGFSIE